MKQYKFQYPDIPVIVDRQMYDYMFNIDRVIREQGMAINRIIEVLNGVLNTK